MKRLAQFFLVGAMLAALTSCSPNSSQTTTNHGATSSPTVNTPTLSPEEQLNAMLLDVLNRFENSGPEIKCCEYYGAITGKIMIGVLPLPVPPEIRYNTAEEVKASLKDGSPSVLAAGGSMGSLPTSLFATSPAEVSQIVIVNNLYDLDVTHKYVGGGHGVDAVIDITVYDVASDSLSHWHEVARVKAPSSFQGHLGDDGYATAAPPLDKAYAYIQDLLDNPPTPPPPTTSTPPNVLPPGTVLPVSDNPAQVVTLADVAGAAAAHHWTVTNTDEYVLSCENLQGGDPASVVISIAPRPSGVVEVNYKIDGVPGLFFIAHDEAEAISMMVSEKGPMWNTSCLA